MRSSFVCLLLLLKAYVCLLEVKDAQVKLVILNVKAQLYVPFNKWDVGYFEAAHIEESSLCCAAYICSDFQLEIDKKHIFGWAHCDLKARIRDTPNHVQVWFIKFYLACRLFCLICYFI